MSDVYGPGEHRRRIAAHYGRLTNATDYAQRRAKLVGYLVEYLEGRLTGLDAETAAWIQEKIDNPPEHIPPEDMPPAMLAPLAELLEVARPLEWALAQAMVDERARRSRS